MNALRPAQVFADPAYPGPVLLRLQNIILEMVATGADLVATCTRLCEEVEALLPDAICSVVTVDEDGLLHPLAGPSLPFTYAEAIDGVGIGPAVGSCGTAAFLGTDIVVTDIANDPRWAHYNSLPLSLGLRACWSSPIRNAQGQTVATFAFYYRERRGPTPFELELVRNCVHLCSIAIDREQRVRDGERRAFTDVLTGLRNRAAFDIALADMGDAPPGAWGLMLLDLDNLKVVNDTFGHQAGDRLLAIAGKRIAKAAHPDPVFRIGGDEFAVLVRSEAVSHTLGERAQSILDALTAPAECQGHIIVPRATAGGAVHGHEDPNVARVRQNADLALYHAKETDRGGFVHFSPDLGSSIARRLEAIKTVSTALSDNRIDAYYQPIFRLDTREIVGMEALCRMRLGEGVVPAAMFHEATRDVDVATALTARMMEIVAADVRRWLDLGIPFQHVGLNLSSADLRGSCIVEILSSAFERARVPLKHVILEVTESVYMGEEDEAVQTAIRSLRAKGIRVALDDFGTGFASLTHLLTVPVDIIKIDKSFIDDLSPDSLGMTIVESLLQIANKLGCRVVAEGVESEAQAELLTGIGCILSQGYLCSEAVERDAATQLLLEHAQYAARGRARMSEPADAESDALPA